MVSKTTMTMVSLSLAAAALVPLALARRGAPTICFPVLTAESFRFPLDADAKPASDTSKAKVAAATLDALRTDSSALGRMEAMRRGVQFLSGGDDGTAQLTKFHDALSADVLDAEALGKSETDRARAWFNLGYANAMLADYGTLGDRGGASFAQVVARTTNYLAKAIALAPQDAQMHVGAAVAHARQNDAREVLFLEHSLAAWRSSDRLARLNVEDSLKRFQPDLLASTPDGVTKNLEQALAKAQKATARNL